MRRRGSVIPSTVALAILTVGDGYALQLRDNIPSIASPGRWALFGGGLHRGEPPALGIRREIREELALDTTDWLQLWRVRYYDAFWDAVVLHVIFTTDATMIWSEHVLREGQKAAVFPIDRLPESMDPIVRALLERYHDQIRR
jgi:8-oxo-dGTP diphosphatase